MKKNSLLFVVALVVITTLVAVSRQKEVTDELVLDNIEALASSEDIHQHCLGDGNLICYNGDRVAYIITNN